MGEKKVPIGRTVMISNKKLNKKSQYPEGKHSYVVVETNKKNELAVVRLTGKRNSNTTNLPNYQDGRSYYKHFIDVEDANKNALKVGKDIEANHSNMDVSKKDVEMMKEKLTQKVKQKEINKSNLLKFRKGNYK